MTSNRGRYDEDWCHDIQCVKSQIPRQSTRFPISRICNQHKTTMLGLEAFIFSLNTNTLTQHTIFKSLTLLPYMSIFHFISLTTSFSKLTILQFETKWPYMPLTKLEELYKLSWVKKGSLDADFTSRGFEDLLYLCTE